MIGATVGKPVTKSLLKIILHAFFQIIEKLLELPHATDIEILVSGSDHVQVDIDGFFQRENRMIGVIAGSHKSELFSGPSCKEDAPVRGLNCYLKFTNLLTFTNAPGILWDPEFAGVVQSRQGNNLAAGQNYKTSPQAKMYMLGISVDF